MPAGWQHRGNWLPDPFLQARWPLSHCLSVCACLSRATAGCDLKQGVMTQAKSDQPPLQSARLVDPRVSDTHGGVTIERAAVVVAWLCILISAHCVSPAEYARPSLHFVACCMIYNFTAVTAEGMSS